jgi:hypothetical protein
MKLYQMTSAYAELLTRLQDQDEDADPGMAVALRDTLEAIEGTIGEKVDGCCRVLSTLEREADAFGEEEKRLQKARRHRENKAESLRGYVQDCLERASLKRVDGPLFTVTLRLNPPSVVVDNLKVLPPEMTVVEVRANKSAIGPLLKAGTAVPGAHLEQSMGLRIQ